MGWSISACARRPHPYAQGKNGKYACPCCQYFTLDEDHYYQICPVCFWEDDGAIKDEDYGGPNHMTLGEGRKAYLRIGSCNANMLKHCRQPHDDEKQ